MSDIDSVPPQFTQNETVPPCAARRSRARDLLEQLRDLGDLPTRMPRAVRPRR